MFDPHRTALMVPRVDAPPLALDMTKIYAAEGRIQDIQIVNAHKAPELLAVFNLAYLELNDHLRKLELCLNEADKAARRVRSHILLDRVPEILKAKGLSSARSPGGSEDQREAILDADDEYVAARDRLVMVRCMIELLKGKREAFEMAYTSVKKVLSGDPSSYGLVVNRNLSAGGSPPPSRQHPKFGGADLD